MFRANRCYDRPSGYQSNMQFKYTTSEMEQMEYPSAMEQPNMMGCNAKPIYECPEERVCHREFVHEVPHICPINTRVINHHIYRHTYTPCYTCCEENEVCNVYDGACSKF